MHLGVLLLAAALGAEALPAGEMPHVLDARLAIELFAADPDIVTPTGIAVDARGRVLAVESHTHFPLDDYPGLKHDRIRMFEDTDGDGRADRITTFFEGTKWTMNVGVHPNGSVYVATRDEIFRLRDTDDDGRADERTQIARLETGGDYPHNGLSGFAFDFAGNVYFGFGENKGAQFKLIAADGSTASELEGGQIYRCGPDGSGLRMVAFGFWNPFHLAFDTFGRLFAVDNDPDSLPPCRLMHIVEGGNYGYRYRNGRKGVHPFTAWNGELPGTLPMVAGTGEAPSGLVAYESDQLPADYVGDLLATSWGDHRIDRFHLEPRGAASKRSACRSSRATKTFVPWAWSWRPMDRCSPATGCSSRTTYTAAAASGTSRPRAPRRRPARQRRPRRFTRRIDRCANRPRGNWRPTRWPAGRCWSDWRKTIPRTACVRSPWRPWPTASWPRRLPAARPRPRFATGDSHDA